MIDIKKVLEAAATYKWMWVESLKEQSPSQLLEAIKPLGDSK